MMKIYDILCGTPIAKQSTLGIKRVCNEVQ